MVSLISHSSLLKNDDVRLKRSPIAMRFCDQCDLASIDDARHMIMECPRWQEDRGLMMGEIANIEDGSCQMVLNAQCDMA